ncbi:MAG TPA: extracellular solute-binding protein [candidate division Zixibacteria bacterium]|nr:extracellular solute-binding protein [candidate division Zixibacteria bacterium]
MKNGARFRKLFFGVWFAISALLLSGRGGVEASGHLDLDAARKEARVMVYSSISLEDLTILTRAFQKRYPGIQVQSYRAGKIKLAQRMVTEARAGKHQFDVLLSSAFTTLEMKLQKLLARYESPERARYRPELKDAEGFWTAAQINTMSVSYNTRLVKQDEAPRRWRDLLHPRWRGKIAINGNRPEWYMALLQAMGEEEGRRYMKTLAEQKTIPVESSTLADELLGAGEFPLYANAAPSNAERIKRKGAPVDWARMAPLPTYPILVSVSAHTRVPNAARLMADFLLSEEGQKVLRDIPRIPARTGIDANPPHLLKGQEIFFMNISAMAGKADDQEEEFRRTFGLR